MIFRRITSFLRLSLSRHPTNLSRPTNPSLKLYSEYRRTPPPGLQLAASILSNPAKLLLQPTKSNTHQEELREEVFKKLKLDRPARLPSKHSDISSYTNSLSSLVVEETIYSITSELERRFDFQEDGKLFRKNGVLARTNNTQTDTGFFECYTHTPLSPVNRNNLRAGAVIFMVPKGPKCNAEDVIFGVIQYGSIASIRLPQHIMQDKDASKKKNETKKKNMQHNSNSNKKGDRLTFFVFDKKQDRSWKDGNDVNMYFVASILNFQRQFSACQMVNKNCSFDNELLGEPPQIDKEENCSTEEENHETKPPDETETVVIPAMNDTQQKATDDFFSDKGGRIKIVQGPPGTGKTTMLSAIICRYILESKELTAHRRLLVCGPTNKSVVVLARKVLQCIRNNNNINVVLIGDKTELLSDNRNELESVFVHAYKSGVIKSWKSLVKKLLQDQNIDRFEDESGVMVSKMRQRIPSLSLFGIEDALVEVVDHFLVFDGKVGDNKHAAETKEILAEVTDEIRHLDEQMIVKDLLQFADVIFCTLSSTGSMPMKRMGHVSDLIVDEASACTEAELLVPLYTKPKRLLLVGDPKQLPATVQSPIAVSFGLNQSLQERLMFKNKFDYTLLNVQYRMQPEISKWPVVTFYDSKVEDGSNVKDEKYASKVALLSPGDPYVWVRVQGEETKDKNMSTMNESEGHAIVALLLDMIEGFNLNSGWFSPDHIRIVTFYKAQEEYIRFKLKQYNINVMVSSVDASQGCEADIIILSFVRGTSGHMGFIKEQRRLNVAMTRAKFQLVCVGNVDAIAGLSERGGNLVLRDMAQDALARCHILPAPGPLPLPPKRTQPKASLTKKNRKTKKKKKKKSPFLPGSKVL